MIGVNKKGFTLVEILVAVSIFTLVVGMATGVFVSALRAQRQSLASQQLLDQTSYAMEYMSRALRMATKDLTGACITVKSNYENPGGDTSKIRFINHLQDDDCQEFFLEDNCLKYKIKIGAAEETSALTSNDLKVKNFDVNLTGETQTESPNLQPKATIFLEIEGKEQSKIKIRTTISQRNLDIKR